MRTPRWLVMGFAVIVLTGCSTLQQEADVEAARVADHVLPKALNRAVASTDPQTTDQRTAVATEWLSDPDGSVSGSQSGATWVMRGSEGTTIRVDVYRYWESGSFFPPDQGKAAWGVACRSYDVAGAVTSGAMECPEDTPATP